MYFWIHLAIALLLTAYFLFRFIKDKLIYQLLFVIWVPSTLLTYVPAIGGNSTMRLVLGVFQLIMFILVIFFMFRRDPKKTAAMKAAMKAEFRGETSTPEKEEKIGSETLPQTADSGERVDQKE